MPKLKKTLPGTPKRWCANVNVDLRTILLGPFEDVEDVRMEAERCMKVGVWDGPRLYPPHAIVFVEIFEKNHGA